MTRRYTLLDLLRDEPRTRETLSYRDLELHRRANDGGRYNVADAAGERLCVLDVGDYDSGGALQTRLDDLSATADTDPAMIDPDRTADQPLRTDGAGVGHAFDHGTLVDVGRELWPFSAMGTGYLAAILVAASAVRLLPYGNVLVGLLGGFLIYASIRLAQADGRRAYVEEGR
ncbi:MAG: hypothetical protein ABEI57_07650 [Halapricum sp.]